MTNCNDGNACTIDTPNGSAANCNAVCAHEPIVSCAHGDGCCPAGCNAVVDDDCSPTCGNAVVEPGETCDPSSSCPTSCSDGNACTIDQLTGSAANCNAVCAHEPIVSCGDGDGCCPVGCNAAVDDDCSATCGNSVVEPGETCDPSTSCLTSCGDGNACTIDQLTGSAANCNAACTHEVIVSCADGDGCCPGGCEAVTDDDCSPSCGNGVVESGESCDPPSGCPADCNDGNACTIDQLTGSAANCSAACTHYPISACSDGDGCCPVGCDAATDDDCSPTCGNEVVEPGETCDPRSTCLTACSDGNACTIDTLTGSGANCNAACTHDAIVSCAHGDSCCPAGCDAIVDDDCSPTCGNETVEPGETCDPPAICLTSCSDGNACTIDALTGSAANCNSACTHEPIVSCVHGDGCCPAGCNATVDDDCSPSCGNSLVEPGETCDPSASCVTGCSDGNVCTIDTLTGSAANCNAACAHDAIVSCAHGDGCCPAGCNATVDDDCSQTCGNETLEPGESCDPPDSCVVVCSDGNGCTIDQLTGSAANCNADCAYESIVSCADGDGCCPAGCNAAVDDDCSPTCGNQALEPGESCDPPDSCITDCNDGNACTSDTLTGSAANCNAACSNDPIATCRNGDGCCPAGCDAAVDEDCSQTCGNEAVEPGETCDPPDSCPTDCDDDNACTIDALTGSAEVCSAACGHQSITDCADGDGCCAPGCTAATDDDCSATCGDDVIDTGETCDPPDSCPTDCDDGNTCTVDRLTGSAAGCSAACSNTAVTSCQDGDGCCAPGCTGATDDDCSATCGNSVVEPGETCDPPSSCPTECYDGDPCTDNAKTGSADSCDVECFSEPVTQCIDDDGCCASGCSEQSDSDCRQTGSDAFDSGGCGCSVKSTSSSPALLPLVLLSLLALRRRRFRRPWW